MVDLCYTSLFMLINITIATAASVFVSARILIQKESGGVSSNPGAINVICNFSAPEFLQRPAPQPGALLFSPRAPSCERPSAPASPARDRRAASAARGRLRLTGPLSMAVSVSRRAEIEDVIHGGADQCKGRVVVVLGLIKPELPTWKGAADYSAVGQKKL